MYDEWLHAATKTWAEIRSRGVRSGFVISHDLYLKQAREVWKRAAQQFAREKTR